MHIAVIGSGTISPDLALPLTQLGGSDVQPRIVNPETFGLCALAYEELLVDVGYVDAAQGAAASGADAIFVNSFADYGIEAARAAVAIPVVGAGEATIAAAAAGGRRFGIVTVWPKSMAFIYAERLRATELAARCVGVWHVSPEEELNRLGEQTGVMQRMARRDQTVIAQLLRACEQACAAGAEAIALGCTCMAPIGPRLQEQFALPVYESSRCGFLATIAAARLAGGGVQYATPAVVAGSARARQQIRQLVDAWLGSASGAQAAGAQGAGEQPLAACQVCISVADDAADHGNGVTS